MDMGFAATWRRQASPRASQKPL